MGKSIYLAGPMGGLPRNSMLEWRRVFGDALQQSGVECKSPTRDVEYLPYLTAAKSVLDRDLFDLRSSDLVVVGYPPDTAARSLGTAMEIAIAHQLHIPVLAWFGTGAIREKTHPMIQACLSLQVDTIHDLITASHSYLNLPW